MNIVSRANRQVTIATVTVSVLFFLIMFVLVIIDDLQQKSTEELEKAMWCEQHHPTLNSTECAAKAGW